jgi:hypothetical protein
MAVFPKVNEFRVELGVTLPEDSITVCAELDAPTLSITNELKVMKQSSIASKFFLFNIRIQYYILSLNI